MCSLIQTTRMALYEHINSAKADNTSSHAEYE